ncbi:MAG: peptidylprolyl isomerase, partial [Gammaproteobacteria bacterium]|nr:peptidylprolyl isomerase [Gammaproteobacteria bacterium]
QLMERNTRLPPAKLLNRQILERTVVKQLQLQLAKATGIMVDDTALNNTLETVASQNNLSIRELRNTLEKDGLDFAQYRESIREQMILGQLLRREVHSRVSLTEQEIDNFIATQTVQGGTDDEYKLSHILVGLPEAATPESIKIAKTKANRLMQNINNGADFNQTAIAESDGPNNLEGGDLGWRRAGQLPTLFAAEVVNMKKGELRGLIRSPSGFHIIKLDDKRPGKRHIVTQTLVRHILIKPNELNTETDVISRLRQLKQRAESGDSFSDLARSHSDDRASAVKGGDLGWTNPGDMVPQFEAAVNRLKKNEISEPFQTQFGWHIAQTLDRRNQDNSEEFGRNQAREFLRQRKADEMQESWLRQLREEAYVEIRDSQE